MTNQSKPRHHPSRLHLTTPRLSFLGSQIPLLPLSPFHLLFSSKLTNTTSPSLPLSPYFLSTNTNSPCLSLPLFSSHPFKTHKGHFFLSLSPLFLPLSFLDSQMSPLPSPLFPLHLFFPAKLTNATPPLLFLPPSFLPSQTQLLPSFLYTFPFRSSSLHTCANFPFLPLPLSYSA